MAPDNAFLGFPMAVDESFFGFSQGEPPNQPLWLPDCRLHVKSDRGVLQNAGAVSRWQDYSGFGRHFAQPTVANQPVWTPNIVNGRPVIRFTSGSSHWMSSAIPALSGPVTVAIVFVSQANENIKGLWAWQNSQFATGGSAYFLCHKTTDNFQYYVNATWPAKVALTTGTPYLHIFSWTGSDWKLYVNNDDVRTLLLAQGTAASGTLMYLGCAYNGYSTMDVAEVWAWGRLLSADEIASLKGAVNAEYALW